MQRNQPAFWLDKSASEAAAFLARTELASRAAGGFIKRAYGLQDALSGAKDYWNTMSPEAKGALGGAGVGALGGAAAGMLGPRKKNPFATALTGGLLGAGIGGGLPLAYRAWNESGLNKPNVSGADQDIQQQRVLQRNQRGVGGYALEAGENATGFGDPKPIIHTNFKDPAIGPAEGQEDATIGGIPGRVAEAINTPLMGQGGIHGASLGVGGGVGLAHGLTAPVRNRVNDYITGANTLKGGPGNANLRNLDLANAMARKQRVPIIGDILADRARIAAERAGPNNVPGIARLTRQGQAANIAAKTRPSIKGTIGSSIGRGLGAAALTEGAIRYGPEVLERGKNLVGPKLQALENQWDPQQNVRYGLGNFWDRLPWGAGTPDQTVSPPASAATAGLPSMGGGRRGP